MTDPVGLTPEPGHYRHRHRRDSPWLPVRVMVEAGRWVVVMAGTTMNGSGADGWEDIPFLVQRWPLTPISADEYAAMVAAMDAAPADHPLADPKEPVNLRNRPSLY